METEICHIPQYQYILCFPLFLSYRQDICQFSYRDTQIFISNQMNVTEDKKASMNLF